MTESLQPGRLVKARKSHDCMASEWLINSCDHAFALEGFSFAERRAIVLAKRDNWKIKPGDLYHFAVLKTDGEIFNFRAIPAIHKMCQEHNIYQDC